MTKNELDIDVAEWESSILSREERLRQVENYVMARRYLHCILETPIISEAALTLVEESAKDLLPETSPIYQDKSYLPESYTHYQKEMALNILEKWTHYE